MTILWFVSKSVVFDIVLWCKWLLKRKTRHAAVICVFLNSLHGQSQVIYSTFPLRAVANSWFSCRLKLSAQKPQSWLQSVLGFIPLCFYSILTSYPCCDKVSYCISYSSSFYILQSRSEQGLLKLTPTHILLQQCTVGSHCKGKSTSHFGSQNATEWVNATNPSRKR